jgi:oligopeptide transport system substrate-binding protein
MICENQRINWMKSTLITYSGARAVLAMLLAVVLPLAVHADAVDYDKQTITLALSQEPPQLNGMKSTDQSSFRILGHVMEGLVRYGRRGKLEPGVAERWEVNAEGATFWLRRNARWSDGSPVTAHDFVFAWRNVVDPATASEYASILYPVKFGEAINTGEMAVDKLGATAVDDFTLRVEFERPVAYFTKLTAFATYFPVQEAFFKKRGQRYGADATDLLYNGAFQLTDWVHSASLRMDKNPRYWNRDKVTLNQIRVDYITADTRSRLNLYIDGKIVHTRLDGDTYKDALTRKLRIRGFPTGSIFFIEYNHRPARVTSNLNLRQAIAHIFSADELVNKVLATPGNIAAESLFPHWLDGVSESFRKEYPAPETPLDIAEGRRLLALAATELGVERIPPMTLLVSDTPTAIKQAEYMQGLLKDKLGLDIRIDMQTFKQRLAKMTSGDFDMVGAGWGPDFDDVMTFGDLFASWNLNNRGRYSNPQYDANIRIAQNSTESRIRMEAMADNQRILFEDAVVLPQYEQSVIYLMHPKLKGVVRNVVGTDPDFTFARIVR